MDHTEPRILIVRLSAFGDAIHGLPVLNALRARYPQAFIGWVVEGRTADLLEGHPALDRLVRAPRGWSRSWRDIADLRRQLRPLDFDITVDLQCLSKSALAAWLSGAPRRLGMAGAAGREVSKWFNNELTPIRAEHAIDRYLEVLRPLGIQSPAVEYNLPQQTADAEFAETVLQQLHLPTQAFAMLNPGASWPSKIWPVERYAQLAERLAERHGMRSLVVWGNASEQEMAQQIVAGSPDHATLAPNTSMMQLAALARRSRVFIGSDTGPTHLAVAVGAPTISLHGTSLAESTGAYGRENVRLQAWYQDGSSRERRTAGNDAMRAITVEQVADACHKLLERHPADSRRVA